MHDLFKSSFKTLSFCTWYFILCTFYWHASRDHICSLGSLYSKIPLREQKRSVHIGHNEVAGETGLRGLSKCIVWLFWGRTCRHVDNASPKTVPQRTLRIISTQSPAQPKSGEYARKPVLTWRTTEIWKKCIFKFPERVFLSLNRDDWYIFRTILLSLC